jgi:hypothetical protein
MKRALKFYISQTNKKGEKQVVANGAACLSGWNKALNPRASPTKRLTKAATAMAVVVYTPCPKYANTPFAQNSPRASRVSRGAWEKFGADLQQPLLMWPEGPCSPALPKLHDRSNVPHAACFAC